MIREVSNVWIFRIALDEKTPSHKQYLTRFIQVFGVTIKKEKNK